MTQPAPKNGHCLCGAVTFTATNANTDLNACHCGMCRRWSGGPFMALSCGRDVDFTGEENIAVFDSSEWAERGFCKQCGSHLFYRLKDTAEMEIPVGLFEGNNDDLKFALQVFIDHKPEYYSFANQTETMTEQQVIDKYVL